MKTPYTFTVLRYVHDVVTGEFANVGVVLFAPKAKFLSAICSSRYGRLTNMFGSVNGGHIKEINRFLQARLEEEGERLGSELFFEKLPHSVLEFTARILPPDDSSFQFSQEGGGITSDPQKTLEELFTRYVESYSQREQRISRSDEEVWKTFKRPLEAKRVLAYLNPHQIIAKNFEFEFKYSWKNAKWHAFEPTSFDLVEGGDILKKANQWLGYAMSLHDGGEPFDLYLLMGQPRDKKMLPYFIKAQNIMHQIPFKHEFIKEENAEEFAEEIRREIKKHDEGTEQ